MIVKFLGWKEVILSIKKEAVISKTRRSHQSTTNEVEGKQVGLDTEPKSWSLVSDFQLPLLLNFNSYLFLALLFPCLDNEENLAMSFT